jgi:ferritin
MRRGGTLLLQQIKMRAFMISPNMVALLNQQIHLESQASNIYLAMASWAEVAGYEGISSLMYKQSSEEREHMLKLFHYINERGGKALVPTIGPVIENYTSVNEMFDSFLKSEQSVSEDINKLVHASLEEQDFTTHNFLQWYVSEQMEEERVARTLLDKLSLIGTDKAGLYLFDRDCGVLAATTV